MNVVKNQHVFPAKSISRFTREDGFVRVNYHSRKKLLNLKPKNIFFCKKSAWSQRAEQGYGKSIEDNFQGFVESYLLKELSTHKCPHKVVSEFFSLWIFRSRIENYDDLLNVKLNGVTGSNLTAEEKNNLELKHMMYINEDGSLDKRFARDIAMQRAIDEFVATKLVEDWHVCISEKMSFIVPDTPCEYIIVPITPSICLCYGGVFKSYLSEKEVREINILAIKGSRQYYFSNDLTRCLYA
jgi:hypothetical protein